MPKLTLNPNPTFASKVEVPIAGGFADVVMTFKHMERPKFAEWIKDLYKKNRVDIVLEIASDWDLDDEFNLDNVTALDNRYMGAANAIIERYMKELSGEREKN